MRNKITIIAAFIGIGFTGVAVGSAVAGEAGKELAGLRRLTESEYRNSIADIFGPGIEVQGRFEPGRRMDGLLSTSSAILSITPAGFDGYSKMADNIAIQVVSEKNRARLVPCTPKSPTAPDDVCATQFLSHYGLMLFRRPLTADELKSRVTMADDLAKSTNNFYTGLRYSLAFFLQAPEFLFRGETAVTADGKDYTLDDYSRASRLSYLMWDTTPDAELLRVAQTGELSTPAGVAKQADRMMASPRLETGMRAFLADMLELDTLGETTKDSLIYPNWGDQVATSADEETLRTAIDLTLKKSGDIRDLMTTRQTYIDRTLASIYGVPFNFSGDWMPYEFPADAGRSGVLTQVSTLAMFSHPGRSSPTERGVAIMDIFMCQPTPLPPANVDFSIVNNTNDPKLRTSRERLLAHATNPTCASCHNHSDPIGLSLEHFDSIGVPRLKENGEVIDVSGKMNGKAFDGASGLGQILHDDPKVPACFARKLYSYATGLDSQHVTPTMFQSAYKSFVDSGYHLRTLLKAMVASPSFFDVPAAKPAATKTAMNALR